jgi:hypothetical protein
VTVALAAALPRAAVAGSLEASKVLNVLINFLRRVHVPPEGAGFGAAISDDARGDLASRT